MLSIPFAIILAAHAPATAIKYVMGSVIALYLADSVYEILFRTSKVECSFAKLETGTLIGAIQSYHGSRSPGLILVGAFSCRCHDSLPESHALQ